MFVCFRSLSLGVVAGMSGLDHTVYCTELCGSVPCDSNALKIAVCACTCLSFCCSHLFRFFRVPNPTLDCALFTYTCIYSVGRDRRIYPDREVLGYGPACFCLRGLRCGTFGKSSLPRVAVRSSRGPVFNSVQ